jgi:DNA-binding CsgD family transcriptional regulator
VASRLERETFALVEQCADQRVTTLSLIDSFHKFVALVGYEHAVAAAAIATDNFMRPERFFFNTLPPAWMVLLKENAEIYAAGLNGSREAMRRMEPFESLELQQGRKMSRLEQRSYELTTGFGWRSIFVVPSHGPVGYRAAVAMLSKKPVDLTPKVRGALRLAGLTLLDRCRTDQHLGRPLPQEPTLSPREIACLREVVSGFSDKDIARKLGLTPHTVHDHIERARTKLGSKTRAQAAAMLVLLGRV